MTPKSKKGYALKKKNPIMMGSCSGQEDTFQNILYFDSWDWSFSSRMRCRAARPRCWRALIDPSDLSIAWAISGPLQPSRKRKVITWLCSGVIRRKAFLTRSASCISDTIDVGSAPPSEISSSSNSRGRGGSLR